MVDKLNEIYGEEAYVDLGNGMFFVRIGGEFIIVDEDDKTLFDLDYLIYEGKDLDDGFYLWGSQGCFWIVDEEGKCIINPGEYPSGAHYMGDGYFKVCKKHEQGIIGSDRNVIIEIGKYNIPLYRKGKFTVVKEELVDGKLVNKVGIIDKDENILIELGKYDSIAYYTDELYMVRRKNKLGLIDLDGNEIINPEKYDKITAPKHGLDLITVNIGNEFGAIKFSTGEEIISPGEYNYGMLCKDGNSIVGDERGRNAIIGKDGEVVVEFGVYDQIEELMKGFYQVHKENHSGVVNTEGKELVRMGNHENAIVLRGNIGIMVDMENNNRRTILVGKDGVIKSTKDELTNVFDKF